MYCDLTEADSEEEQHQLERRGREKEQRQLETKVGSKSNKLGCICARGFQLLVKHN